MRVSHKIMLPIMVVLLASAGCKNRNVKQVLKADRMLYIVFANYYIPQEEILPTDIVWSGKNEVEVFRPRIIILWQHDTLYFSYSLNDGKVNISLSFSANDSLTEVANRALGSIKWTDSLAAASYRWISPNRDNHICDHPVILFQVTIQKRSFGFTHNHEAYPEIIPVLRIIEDTDPLGAITAFNHRYGKVQSKLRDYIQCVFPMSGDELEDILLTQLAKMKKKQQETMSMAG